MVFALRRIEEALGMGVIRLQDPNAPLKARRYLPPRGNRCRCRIRQLARSAVQHVVQCQRCRPLLNELT
jgi:hypothetical protein